jgi:nicotinamidase-related amidase
VIDTVTSFVGPNLPVLEAQKQIRTACGEYAWRAIPAIARLLERFRTDELPVLFTTADWRLDSMMGGATRGGQRRDLPTDDAVVAELEPLDGELVVAKAKASIFYGTPISSFLVKNNVDSLIVTGGTTSGCVRASAVDACSMGLDVWVVEDACFDRVPLCHDVSMIDIDTKYGRVVDSSEVMTLLDTRRTTPQPA